MRKLILFIIFFVAIKSYANTNDTTIGKNIIGIDINYAEFLGFSEKYDAKKPNENGMIYIPFINFNLRYNRHLHRYVDVATSLGFTTIYIGYLGYLKFNVLPLITPLKQKYKTLQIGSGFSLLKFTLDKEVYFGLTNQFNYIKKSKKKNFAWGVNLYGNVYFPKKTNDRIFFIGTGFFLGGYFK